MPETICEGNVYSEQLSISILSYLGLIHTRHFDTQYCDKEIF